MKNQDLPGEWNNIDERKKIRCIKHVIYTNKLSICAIYQTNTERARQFFIKVEIYGKKKFIELKART